GVEADFHPARKAHPGLRVNDLDDLAKRLAGAGYEPKWDTDLPDIRRFHVSDPVGNRLETIQEAHQAGHAGSSHLLTPLPISAAVERETRTCAVGRSSQLIAAGPLPRYRSW